MRRRVLLAATLAIAAIAAAHPAAAAKRIALVIGNASYQNVPRLANPLNDATSMTDLFRRAGFDTVEARRDLGVADFRRALNGFTLSSRTADVAVVFFAGHGIEVSGTNYLIPVDAKLATDLDVRDEAIPLDRVLEAVEPAKRLRLVLIDACRDNPFSAAMQRTIATRTVSRGLAQVITTTTDTLIGFAAKHGSTAEDGGGSNSPFTTALLQHLPVPGLDVQLALRQIRNRARPE